MRGCGLGIPRLQRHFAAALRMQHHDPAREAVRERCLERLEVWPRPEGRRGQQYLGVGQGQFARCSSGRRRCRRARRRQNPCRRNTPCASSRRNAIVAHHRKKRTGFPPLIHQNDRHMILQIAADARNRRLTSMPCAPELIRIAHPGQHQKLRRVDDAARQDDLAARPRRVQDAGAADIRPRLRGPVDQNPGRERMYLDCEIAAVAGRDAGTRSPCCSAGLCRWSFAAARTLADLRHCSRRSSAWPALAAGLRRKRRAEDPGIRRFYGERPVAAAISAGAAFPALLFAEIREHSS